MYARACVRLGTGLSYFTDSSLFNFRLYGNTYKMRGCVSLHSSILPEIYCTPTLMYGSLWFYYTTKHASIYIPHPPTLHGWRIPAAFHLLSSCTGDHSIVKCVSVVNHSAQIRVLEGKKNFRNVIQISGNSDTYFGMLSGLQTRKLDSVPSNDDNIMPSPRPLQFSSR
jgi:hypothetical protein